jgi:hypothetical protein
MSQTFHHFSADGDEPGHDGGGRAKGPKQAPMWVSPGATTRAELPPCIPRPRGA